MCKYSHRNNRKNIYTIKIFIDKRRREFPQYYIMSNQEIMYLYGHKKDEKILKRIINRLYPWVKDIIFNYNIDNYGNDEYIKINTVDNEIILFKNVKGLKELKDYIDIISNELIKRMKERFKAHKKNNDIMYKNKSTKKINDVLNPIITDVNGNLLIQEIFNCVYYSVMDCAEKSLKSNDVFDKLFELYNICKLDITSEIIKIINEDKNGVNRIKYFCLLGLINYLIGFLENLMHDDVQSPSDFSFIKYLNPKIESDTLIFYLLGNLCSIEYGYEYVGKINSFLLLNSNEKMFIEIMSAYEYYKRPIIINENYIKVENDNNSLNKISTSLSYDNISILCLFLGKNIKDYTCNKNTDINIFKSLLCAYCKCGPWIRFNNIYNLNSIHDFEIISNQIIEVYYQIKHSDEEFISINNGNKIIINNKNFNIFINYNDDDFDNKNKDLFYKNIYHYYRTINYIQINLEFYIQMNMINLGFINYELIMNKILVILKYIYCKLFCNLLNCSEKSFIYFFFDFIVKRIIHNKNYQIQINNEISNNMSLISINEYENNIIYQEIKNIIEICYKNRINNDVYKNILNNLEQIFNIKKLEKDDKKRKTKILK